MLRTPMCLRIAPGTLTLRSFDPIRRGPDSQTSRVSYLAQTRKSAPVILYLPECVAGATIADFVALIRRSLRAGSGPNQGGSDTSSSSAFFIRVYAAEPHGERESTRKTLEFEIRATPPGG
jgi:hypothetical protein